MFRGFLLLFAGVLCLGNTSCDKITAGKQFDYNVPFNLTINEMVHSADGALSLIFIEVSNDSRCPEDVVCVTAGNAEVLLGVETGGVQLEIILNSTDGLKEQSVNGWVIRLLDLQPTPRSDQQIEPGDYAVTLQVEN